MTNDVRVAILAKENTRLRAEVRRYKEMVVKRLESESLRGYIDKLERECDETRAQVAVLISHIEVYLRWLHAPCEGQSGVPIAENQKAALLALEQVTKFIPAKARAPLRGAER